MPTHEENLKDITWVTEQYNRLKTECDLANTKLAQFVAEDKVEQAKLREQIEQLKHVHRNEVTKIETMLQNLQSNLNTTKLLAEKRRVALADVLKLTAAVLEKCAPLVSE